MHTNQANSQSIKPPTNILRVILVDDQKFVQHKLQQMLSSEVDLKIVGVANDGETAIALVETLEPDVVLIDIEMPKMNGIEATKIIAERFPNCKILILSSYEHQEYVQNIIVVGADGYILKTTSAKDLVTAIHSVCNGYAHFGSQLFKKIQLAQNAKEISGVESSKPLVSNDYLSLSQQSNSQQLALRQADELLPPVSKWLTWGGISVVTIIALAIPASAIFKYKTVVKAQAIARLVEELHLVQAAVEGQVSQILVKKGQAVEKGEAIATGTIFQLGLNNQGQMVQSGQEIAQIIPKNFQIEMKAAVSPQDISKLEVGQEAQMRVSACPYPDYGILKGRVSQIAKDTSKPSSQPGNDLQAQKAATFYEVAIAPNSDSFGRQEYQCSLQLGMESRADIISRKETMLQFILRKARLTTNL
ncbi:MAG: response regulator [Pleurocapsa sp. SU_5_0]|nr:response regulator [Pleurocapsa sp. SU_5_0]NJO94882.1 response regulator [Pleurocapsa sp. CRU_1_2]